MGVKYMYVAFIAIHQNAHLCGTALWWNVLCCSWMTGVNNGVSTEDCTYGLAPCRQCAWEETVLFHHSELPLFNATPHCMLDRTTCHLQVSIRCCPCRRHILVRCCLSHLRVSVCCCPWSRPGVLVPYCCEHTCAAAPRYDKKSADCVTVDTHDQSMVLMLDCDWMQFMCFHWFILLKNLLMGLGYVIQKNYPKTARTLCRNEKFRWEM